MTAAAEFEGQLGSLCLLPDPVGSRDQREQAFEAGRARAAGVQMDVPGVGMTSLARTLARRSAAAGVTYDVPKPFLVIATQNPIDMDGTYPCRKPGSTGS